MATPASFGLNPDGSAYDDSFDSLDEYFVPRVGYVDLGAASLDDGRLDHDDGSQPPDASLILKFDSKEYEFPSDVYDRIIGRIGSVIDRTGGRIIQCRRAHHGSEDLTAELDHSNSCKVMVWAVFDNLDNAVRARHRFGPYESYTPRKRLRGQRPRRRVEADITVNFTSEEEAMKDMCFVQDTWEFFNFTRIAVTYTGDGIHPDRLVEEEMENIGPVRSCERKSSDQPWLDLCYYVDFFDSKDAYRALFSSCAIRLHSLGLSVGIASPTYLTELQTFQLLRQRYDDDVMNWDISDSDDEGTVQASPPSRPITPDEYEGYHLFSDSEEEDAHFDEVKVAESTLGPPSYSELDVIHQDKRLQGCDQTGSVIITHIHLHFPNWETSLVELAANIIPYYVRSDVPVSSTKHLSQAFIDSFTPYSELRRAREENSNEDFAQILERLRNEWYGVSAGLLALAAVEAAVFGFSENSVFRLADDAVAAQIVALGSLASVLGLCSTLWMIIRYAFLGSRKFRHATLDIYGTYAFFCISCRLPAILMGLSTLSLTGFIVRVSWAVWPSATIVLCASVCVVAMLQYIVLGAHAGFKLMSRFCSMIRKLTLHFVARVRMDGGLVIANTPDPSLNQDNTTCLALVVLPPIVPDPALLAVTGNSRNQPSLSPAGPLANQTCYLPSLSDASKQPHSRGRSASESFRRLGEPESQVVIGQSNHRSSSLGPVM